MNGHATHMVAADGTMQSVTAIQPQSPPMASREAPAPRPGASQDLHSPPMSRLSNMQIGQAIDGLRNSTMFSKCNEEHLRLIANRMQRVAYRKGDVLLEQGESQERMYVVTDGTIERSRYANGRLHIAETLGSQESRNTVGALHLVHREPCYGTTVCLSDVVAYTLDSEALQELLAVPGLGRDVVHALAKEIRRRANIDAFRYRTPVLQQQPRDFAVMSTSVGAALESGYRSAMNAKLNQNLTGKLGPLFPNMHIQLPTRVAYINGFKLMRTGLNDFVEPDTYAYPNAVRLGLACLPGILMSPVSSLLEACNAGHSNPEPLHLRASRGLLPRGVREIIFGLGINQLSEWCEERVPIDAEGGRNFVGSIVAGVACGYLSHVPHNLSTLKLMEPSKTYTQHMETLTQQSMHRVPNFVPASNRWSFATAASMLAPRGVAIRSAQIAGSFVIINGTIRAMSSAKDE